MVCRSGVYFVALAAAIRTAKPVFECHSDQRERACPEWILWWATTLFYSGWYLVDLEIFVHSHALATDVQSGLSPKAL